MINQTYHCYFIIRDGGDDGDKCAKWAQSSIEEKLTFDFPLLTDNNNETDPAGYKQKPMGNSQ